MAEATQNIILHEGKEFCFFLQVVLKRGLGCEPNWAALTLLTYLELWRMHKTSLPWVSFKIIPKISDPNKRLKTPQFGQEV